MQQCLSENIILVVFIYVVLPLLQNFIEKILGITKSKINKGERWHLLNEDQKKYKGSCAPLTSVSQVL